jgi:DNA-directed RNA polymerase specialized sigma24 family protein
MECDEHEKQFVSDEDSRYADVDEAISVMEEMDKLDNSKLGVIMRKRLNGETFQSIAKELKMDINKVQRSYKVGIVEIKKLLGM